MTTKQVIDIIKKFGGTLKWDSVNQRPVWSGKKPKEPIYSKLLAVMKEHKPRIIKMLQEEEQSQ